jgi:hypothetical protein
MVTQILVSCDTCRNIHWIWEHMNTGKSSEAMKWFRCLVNNLSMWRSRFNNHRPVHVNFVLDKVVLEKSFSQCTSVFPSVTFHPSSTLTHQPVMLHTLKNWQCCIKKNPNNNNTYPQAFWAELIKPTFPLYRFIIPLYISIVIIVLFPFV